MNLSAYTYSWSIAVPYPTFKPADEWFKNMKYKTCMVVFAKKVFCYKCKDKEAIKFIKLYSKYTNKYKIKFNKIILIDKKNWEKYY